MPRVFFARSRRASFIELDLQLLRERYEIRDWYQSRVRVNPLAVLRSLRGCDAVVAWWASIYTFWPITLGWLLRKPSLLIVGGVDVANLPEIEYGYQQGGPRKWVSRWVMRRARRLATNSRYSQRELERNVGIPADRVAVMHHGFSDPFGALPRKPDHPIVLTVGVVDVRNLERKGHRSFVEAAGRLPEFSFVLAGRWEDDAVAQLRALAPANVTLTGWIEDDELRTRFTEAAVYVQASRHEGFGVAVAEAMLAGCVPVVTTVGALPEVVGDIGVQVSDQDPDRLAEAIRAAEAMGPEMGGRARERILSEFPLEERRRKLWMLVDELLD
jgi:glycosyltransferase involved in cell wall biosynthesis